METPSDEVGPKEFTEEDLEINKTLLGWTGRVMSFLDGAVRTRIRLHAPPGALEEGEVFLFNHFARFETFIPPYILYKATGAPCRSVASKEFFIPGDSLSELLLSLGAVPNNYPELLPFLAKEIVRGRKVIVFPEGGMIKDRRVVDERGKYSVYSPSSLERRKHHTGAAVLVLGLEMFRAMIRDSFEKDTQRLDRWASEIGVEPAELVRFGEKKGGVVPANITFYPIRVDENLLEKGAHLLAGDSIGKRLSEELLIEGNLLLKKTDMDIRFGEPFCACDMWSWVDRAMISQKAGRFSGLDELFERGLGLGGMSGRYLARRNEKNVLRLRDCYMEDMYSLVTVNLSHVVSRLIMEMVARGDETVETEKLHRLAYLTVKELQREEDLHLHESVSDPDLYGPVLGGGGEGMERFFKTAYKLELLESVEGHYKLLPKLYEELEFNEVRIENHIAVYANESMPIGGLKRALDTGLKKGRKTAIDFTEQLFDDEMRRYESDLAAFSGEEHREVNEKQAMTESGEPYLLIPRNHRDLGVLLVHGFTASPAEMRPLADRLLREGYYCHGVRLRGHGTSPWDMEGRHRDEWRGSVARGFEILRERMDRVCVVGFSMGGLLGLELAGYHPDHVAGVVSICAPMTLRDKNMMLVPLIHVANVLVDAVTPQDGVNIKTFHESDPEHPHVNYRHMPIASLHEMDLLIGEVKDKLSNVHCPALILQGDDDPTVTPDSADYIFEKLGSRRKTLEKVHSHRHGLVYGDLGNTHHRVERFLEKLDDGL